MDNTKDTNEITSSLECESTFSLDCDTFSNESQVTCDIPESATSSLESKYGSETTYSSEEEYSSSSDSEWYQRDEPEAIKRGGYLESIIATDIYGNETTFENSYKASETLGISNADIIKCCKNIRGYEYITVDDKKYSFREK